MLYPTELPSVSQRGRTRTCDLRHVLPVLYPTELPVASVASYSLHITWRYTIFVEIPQWTHHLIFLRPKSPLTIRPRTNEQCPGTARWNIQVMPFICFGIPPRSGFNIETSIRSDVGIVSPENQRHKVTSVIMEESLVVRTNPMVDSNGKAEK